MMNQRPFKFRIYNKKLNRFVFHVEIGEIKVPPNNGLLGATFDSNEEDKGAFKTEDCVIQQFTGLFDSAGKEVYEGDIVLEKMTNEIAFYGDECNLGRVFFAAGTFMIDGDGPLYDHTYSLTPDKLEDYLVVGNVFENPELCCKN